jgi:hypothetical protein
MKIIFYILFLVLFLTTNSFSFGSVIGKGKLIFSSASLEHFIKYIVDKNARTFIISKDGRYSSYSKCGRHQRLSAKTMCVGGKGSTRTMLKNCKKIAGVKCYTFAMRKDFDKKVIRWNNINYEFNLIQTNRELELQKNLIQTNREFVIQVLKENSFY